MKNRDLVAVESIDLNGKGTGKTDVLNQCVEIIKKSGKIADVEKYRKGVFERG